MTREAIEYFKFQRKIFCEEHLKICPKDSIAYQATLKEKEFYDMAIKALEQNTGHCAEQESRKGHWKYDYTSADGHRTYHCSECGCYLQPKHSEPLSSFKWCSLCGADMRGEE